MTVVAHIFSECCHCHCPQSSCLSDQAKLTLHAGTPNHHGLCDEDTDRPFIQRIRMRRLRSQSLGLGEGTEHGPRHGTTSNPRPREDSDSGDGQQIDAWTRQTYRNGQLTGCGEVSNSCAFITVLDDQNCRLELHCLEPWPIINERTINENTFPQRS